MNSSQIVTAPTVEVTTRHDGHTNVPTTYIRLGDDEITVTGHPRCSIFHVMDRKHYQKRGEDVTDLDIWEAGASHMEVAQAMTRYLEAGRVLGVYHACRTCSGEGGTCPTCNGSGEVMGVVAA